MTIQAKPIVELKAMPKCESCGAQLPITGHQARYATSVRCDYCGTWFYYYRYDAQSRIEPIGNFNYYS